MSLEVLLKVFNALGWPGVCLLMLFLVLKKLSEIAMALFHRYEEVQQERIKEAAANREAALDALNRSTEAQLELKRVVELMLLRGGDGK